MKFTTGAMVGDLSGSIGSTTASHNRFGPYFRSKVIPVNPNTSRQQAVRSVFTTLVNAWNNTLTQVQRDGWSNWAAMTTIQGKDGNPINITGQNAYIRFNTVRLQIGQNRVDAPPTVFNNGAPVTGFFSSVGIDTNEIGILAGDLSTTIAIGGAASVDGDLAVWFGGPVNTSRKFFKGPYQFSLTAAVAADDVLVVLVNSVTSLEQDIVLVDGQIRSLRARMIYDDGRLSEKFEQLAEVEEDV